MGRVLAMAAVWLIANVSAVLVVATFRGGWAAALELVPSAAKIQAIGFGLWAAVYVLFRVVRMGGEETRGV
jgi:hypothetical protein